MDGAPSVPEKAESPRAKKGEAFLTTTPFSKGIRGLDAAVCRKYGYLQAISPTGAPLHVAELRDTKGTLVAQKIRTRDKKFWWIGKTSKLFGSHLWSKGKRLIITEGEIDALSVASLDKARWPVVAVTSGASGAAKQIRENLTWLSGFSEIILAFDGDEAGREGAEAAAQALPPGAAHIAVFPDGEDCNSVLRKDPNTLRSILWGAQPYRPDGLVDAKDLLEEVLKPVECGLSYPWAGLTKATYGIRENELIVFGAGTGMGKTSFFKEIALHLVTQGAAKVGLLLLEESNRDTCLHLMSKHSGRDFHSPDSKETRESREEEFASLFGSSKFVLYDSFGATDYETIALRIRHMVQAEGCKVVFLDHITALGDGVENEKDVNQRMRNVVSGLAGLTRELGFTLFAISHLRKAASSTKSHEEGGRVTLDSLYGAAALKQWASFVIGLERNQQAEDEEERHRTTLRILKDRYTGQSTGKTFAITYDPTSMRLTEEAGYGF